MAPVHFYVLWNIERKKIKLLTPQATIQSFPREAGHALIYSNALLFNRSNWRRPFTTVPLPENKYVLRQYVRLSEKTRLKPSGNRRYTLGKPGEQTYEVQLRPGQPVSMHGMGLVRNISNHLNPSLIVGDKAYRLIPTSSHSVQVTGLTQLPTEGEGAPAIYLVGYVEKSKLHDAR